MFEFLGNGNNVTRKVEKKGRIEGQIKVLQNEQKAKAEAVVTEYNQKKIDSDDSINAQIVALQARIESLKIEKETQKTLLDKEQKVKLEKVINHFDVKIISKQNQVKRLGRYIDAERANIDDVMNQPSRPNEPRPLLEGTRTKRTK